jgi:hypothetical protein
MFEECVELSAHVGDSDIARPSVDRGSHHGLLCASHLLGMLSNNQPRELAL